MIKEILLSLAVAAFSGVSSFVGSPKRLITDSSSVYGTYTFYFDYHNLNWSASTPFGESDGSLTYDSQNQEFVFDYENSQTADYRIRGGYTSAYGSFSFYWYFSNYEMADDFNENWLLPINAGTASFSSNMAYCDDAISEPESTQEGYRVYLSFAWDEWPEETEDGVPPVYVSLPLGNRTYSLEKNYINCDIASSPRLPDTFTSANQLSYYVLMVSNAGGYGFTAQSVTQTGGITIRNFNLIDQYNNSGYYAACSFNVDLPLNNCSLSVTAFLPQYTITSTLEHCTVSPSLPASYTGTSFSGDYTFTAVSGYGFNENYTHWEVSNLFVDSVEFSSLLWGSFYSSVTLHLRASGGNSSISVTAIKYDEESYKLGYEEGREDGWQAGYDRGHADGEIAGDSYGVWNWLKQAAITTGEFLSIPLLPGFSIGGLLTAIAGLVIIWFFIKGFLFKS